MSTDGWPLTRDDGRAVTYSRDGFAASHLRQVRVEMRLSREVDDRTLTRKWLVGVGDDQRID